MNLSIIIALSAAIAPQTGGLLDSERNLPRPGDQLTLIELTTPIYDADSTCTLDLSAAKNPKEATKRYTTTDDSLLMELTGGEVRIYATTDGSLTLLEERKPGQCIRAVNPERTLTLPAAAGEGESGYFITFGRLGTLGEIQESGRTESSVSEHRHTLVTPEGDTLRNVTHRRYLKTGAMSAWLTPPPYPTVKDTLIIPVDSIERFLTTDTITHRRTVDSWYLDGYRYPIAEQTVDQIYYQGVMTDIRHRTLYYPLFTQENEITDDPVNQAIRDERQMRDFATAPPVGGSRAAAPGRNGTDSHDPTGVLGLDGTFDDAIGAKEATVKVWPTVVDDKTTVTLNLPSASTVIVKLSNQSGAEMWVEACELAAGTHSIDCPTAQLIAGSYILTVDTGADIHTTKLIKR